MVSIVNASPTNGIVQTADGSGVLKVQSNGVTTNALAWVNFNGTGTVAIRSSYNVSSITDNGTGDYTVNFATALADANYAITGSLNYRQCFMTNDLVTPRTTTAARITTSGMSGSSVTGPTDNDYVSVAVFGN